MAEKVFKILLVEDSEVTKDLVAHTLGVQFEIIFAPNLQEAMKCISSGQFDLILLDIGLPDGDGLRFFPMLLNSPQYKQTPVIFLTANSDTSAKVLGITLGAEDYIVKPFEPAEFKARIEMRLKKYISHQKEEMVLRKGDLEINIKSQRACRVVTGNRIDLQLTPLEFKLLATFMMNEDQLFTRNQLFDKVWGPDIFQTDRCVDTHICSLRKKLGELSDPIKTIYGEGYRYSLK